MCSRPRCSRGWVRAVAALFIIGLTRGTAAAQATQSAEKAAAEPVTAFVGVNVVPMDANRVLPDQTVIIRGHRIAAIGGRSGIVVPERAIVIEGRGRYLLPGLTDAHVHLVGDGTAGGSTRPDFGDAPLYLVHGVTTVLNLRGTSEQIEWRDRIAAGLMVGPTIYTAGEFVNEPRVKTAEEVSRDIAEQARAGYDIVKYHEIFGPAVGSMTTTGLSREAYLAMVVAAREHGRPIVGHAPVNLGLDVLIEARQPLAHLGMLSNIHFLPVATSRLWLLVTAASFATITVFAMLSLIARPFRWGAARPSAARPRSRVERLVAFASVASAGAVVLAAVVLPGGPWFRSDLLRVVLTASGFGLTALAAWIIASASWQSKGGASWSTLVGPLLAGAATLVFAMAVLVFWSPVAWRSSASNVDALARRLAAASISVQTTLVNYDALGGPGRQALTVEPALAYLERGVRNRWSQLPAAAPGWSRYTQFMQYVAGALHRNGVALMAGTDSMGFPLVVPGASLHHELRLLAESGLTPYDVLRTATIAPAAFLGRSDEFGSVAAGRRADLLLVEGNPLDDLARLRRPEGVMTRGRWFTREDLEQMLGRLTNSPD